MLFFFLKLLYYFNKIKLIINTVGDKRSAVQDSYSIRHAVLQARVTYFTTLAGARAACIGMANIRELKVYDLQKLHKLIKSELPH